MENLLQEQAYLLNNLVEANNDRIAGYTKYIELLPKDTHNDIDKYLRQYRDQSDQFITDLKPFVYEASEFPQISTTISSKLRNMWLDLKNSFVEDTIQSILNDCEKREDIYKRVYHHTLEEKEVLTLEAERLIRHQAILQLQAHDHIKSLRDKNLANCSSSPH